MNKHYLVIHSSLEGPARELFGDAYDYYLSEDLSLPQEPFDPKKSFRHIQNKSSKKQHYGQKLKK